MIPPLELVSVALECSPDDVGEDSALGVHPRWDSFAQVRIMVMLEDSYGIEIDDASIRAYSSYAAIRDHYATLTERRETAR